MRTPFLSLSDDNKTVILSRGDAEARLSAQQVDEMLATLRELRGRMMPPHPRAFPLGTTCYAIIEPNWVTESDATFTGSTLHVRDPGYGWLHYFIGRQNAELLVQSLQFQISAAAKATKGQSRN